MLWNTGYSLDFGRSPFTNLLHHFFHSINPLTDKFLVFPAVFENMPHHAPDNGYIGAWTDLEIVIRVSGSAGKTWVDHYHGRIIFFFCLENMLQRNRVCLSRV